MELKPWEIGLIVFACFFLIVAGTDLVDQVLRCNLFCQAWTQLTQLPGYIKECLMYYK
jgi:hypothetical protein